MKEGSPEYMEKSKELLEENACKKIKTTMIGALESIEKFFGEFMDDEKLQEAFVKTREDILNKGNKQIKNMKKELSSYNISRKRYHIKIPVKRWENKDGKNI